MGCFDDLNLLLEVHHQDGGGREARAFLLHSAASSTGCGPSSWLLSLFELKGGTLSRAWSGGWSEDDMDGLRDLMPEAEAAVFAKRVGSELAGGGAFLDVPTKSSASIKLKIQNPTHAPTLRPFVVKLHAMPESDWLSGMTAFASDAVKLLARQRTLVVRRQSPSPPPARKVVLSPVAFSSQLSVPSKSQARRPSVEEQRIQMLERQNQQLRDRTARAEAASQSPVKSQPFIDHNVGKPKGMSMANPNVKEARPTSDKPFDTDSDEDGDDAELPPKASTANLSPDEDGSITDPGKTAAVTPVSVKRKSRAFLVGSDTESNSDEEATLGSPTRWKSKPAPSELQPGSSPARFAAEEPESFAKTLSKTNAKRLRLYDSEPSGEDAPEPSKPAASKKSRASVTGPSPKRAAQTSRRTTATTAKAINTRHDFDDDSDTESD